jgi:hypothetical protein
MYFLTFCNMWLGMFPLQLDRLATARNYKLHRYCSFGLNPLISNRSYIFLVIKVNLNISFNKPYPKQKSVFNVQIVIYNTPVFPWKTHWRKQCSLQLHTTLATVQWKAIWLDVQRDKMPCLHVGTIGRQCFPFQYLFIGSQLEFSFLYIIYACKPEAYFILIKMSKKTVENKRSFKMS